MDSLTKATNIDHEETVGSRIKRVFFSSTFVKPGEQVNIVVETQQVADNSEVKIKVYAEDDNNFILDENITGQISSNRCTIQYSPAEGSADEAVLKEKLGVNMFREFRCKAEIETLNLENERSDNILGFGQIGAIIEGLDDCFAPRKETQVFRYKFIDPDKEIKGAKIYVYASNYDSKNYPDAGALVFKRAILPSMRLHKRSRKMRWMGQSFAEAGPLQKSDTVVVYINPQYSPYTVEIKYSLTDTDPDQDNSAVTNRKRSKDDGTEVDWQFEVKYHSVHMEMGAFVPAADIPTPGSDRNKWIQYRLNTLGYPCGPVDGDIGNMSKRAVKNFQRANWEMPWPADATKPKTALVADSKAGPKTRKAMLSDKAEKREWFDPAKDLFDSTKSVKLYHWANLYYQYETTVENGKNEWNVKKTDEFYGDKHKIEAKNFNRPRIPIIGKIQVKTKAGKGVFVPECVGDVRVNFTIEDPTEELDITSTTGGAATRKFVQGAANEEAHEGDNCAEKYSGTRTKDANKHYKKYIHIGEKLLPYTAEDDSSKKVVFVNALTEGPGRGTVGIFFIPSHIAGDNYQIVAKLDFENHPNQANIDTGGNPIETKSAKITNWRKMKMAAYLTWGTRNNAVTIAQIEQALASYRNAFIEFTAPTAIHPVTRYLSAKEYKQTVIKTLKIKKTSEKNKIRLLATSIYYKNLRVQNPTETPAAYKLFVRTAVKPFIGKIEEPIGRVIVNNVKKFIREGAVIIDSHTHEPVNVKVSATVNETYRCSNHAIGLCNGLVYLNIMLNENNNMDFLYLLAHEIGHTQILWHWENTGSGTMVDAADYEKPDNFRSNKKQHDHDDDYCIMSYPIDFYNFPSPPALLVLDGDNINNKTDYINFIKKLRIVPHRRLKQISTNCRPHFCGKCLLKLRGWNVEPLPTDY
jgi:hypothetical protein